MPLEVIGHVGRQACGDVVVSPTVQFTKDGDLVATPKYIWSNSVLCGDYAPMAADIPLPIDSEAGKAYYLELQRVLPVVTFNNMLLVAG